MRILGYIENTPYKVTVFQMNHKFTVKFETGMYELAFKLREAENMKGLEDIEKFVDEDLITSVKRRFHEMHRAALSAFAKLNRQNSEDEFDEII
jgi:hypothetical protein